MKVTVKKPEEKVTHTPLYITVGEKQKEVNLVQSEKVASLRHGEAEVHIPLDSWDALVEAYYQFYHGEAE